MQITYWIVLKHKTNYKYLNAILERRYAYERHIGTAIIKVQDCKIVLADGTKKKAVLRKKLCLWPRHRSR